MVSYETELVALAIVLYLFDSTLMLYVNEAVLIQDGSGQWAAATGWERFGIGGRLMYVLNPFTPNRPSFRLSWSYHALPAAPAAVQSWSECAAHLRPLALIGPLVALGLFVALPVGLFTAAGSYAVIPALVLIYGSALAGLILLYRRRSAAALSAKRFAAIALECLLCPPLAVNILRRTTLGMRIREDVPSAGARLLPAESWARLREHCLRRLEAAIQSLPDGAREISSLQAQQQRLRELA
jgi:hypothetical protein